MMMQVNLSAETQSFVQEQLASGKYPDESSLVEFALQQLRDRARKLAEIQRAMREADADAFTLTA